MKTVDLVIPGLLGPFSADLSENIPPHIHLQLNESGFQPLKKWLSKAQMQSGECSSLFSTLVDLIAGAINLSEGKTSQCELTAEYDGIDTSSGFFYRADPVHFKAEADHAVLLGSPLFLPQDEEMHALINAFNLHFQVDGIRLHGRNPHRWYLQTDRELNLKFNALDYSLGRDIKHFMPEGEDALWWRRILNEAQMLFFQHEVNQLREARGQLTINGLWLWDQCVEPGQIEKTNQKTSDSDKCINRYQKIYTDATGHNGQNNIQNNKQGNKLDNALVLALAECVSKTCVHLPVESLVDKNTLEAGSLVVLEQLYESVCYGDIDAWLEALRVFCSEQFPRIIELLKAGVVDEVNIYPCDGRVFKVNRGQLIKFWKPVEDIEFYFSVPE